MISPSWNQVHCVCIAITLDHRFSEHFMYFVSDPSVLYELEGKTPPLRVGRTVVVAALKPAALTRERERHEASGSQTPSSQEHAPGSNLRTGPRGGGWLRHLHGWLHLQYVCANVWKHVWCENVYAYVW